MIRLQRAHRANARAWLSDTCSVLKYDLESSEWEPTEVRCVVQQPRGADSSQDPEISSADETAAIIAYVEHASNVEVGDRLEWSGETFVVNTAAWRRTDQPYRKLVCSVLQSALVPESVTFYRVVHNTDGEIVGRDVVGEYVVRFTEGMAIDPVAEQEGARSKLFDGKIIAPLDASAIVVGDWFSRNGVPGRVTAVERTAPDHIEMTYSSEKAVP